MKRQILSGLIGTLALVSFSAFANPSSTNPQSISLSPAFGDMQRLETKANAVSNRSDQPIAMEHYEIPLDFIESDMSIRIDPRIARSLIFKNDGVSYVRWMINPEDTKWKIELENYLKSKNIPIVKGHYFTGYQTASRSYLLRDPQTGVEFSAKVSTNVTGGNWVNKKQTWEDAHQVRMAYKYIDEVVKQAGQLKNALIIDEPAAFGIKDIDQGMLIRTYDSLRSQNTRLIPGFSALYDSVGANIAKLNGSDDPAAFWNEHYNKPLARALAEVYAITGVSYDSPHSQNFLIETDAKFKPTGRIALRDMGDVYMVENVFTASGPSHKLIPGKWEHDNVIRDRLHISVGLLHGNAEPSWISTIDNKQTPDSYDQWGRDFFSEFEKEFARVTGVDVQATGVLQRKNKYMYKDYSLLDQSGKEYLNWISSGRVRKDLPGHHSPVSCPAVFKHAG